MTAFATVALGRAAPDALLERAVAFPDGFTEGFTGFLATGLRTVCVRVLAGFFTDILATVVLRIERRKPTKTASPGDERADR
jgi:hypothetical protein